MELDLDAYDRIVILTGAGISVASGLRPYRGPGGLWTENPGLLSQTHAAAAAADPDQIWRVFGPMRAEALLAEPNPGHRALVRPDVTIITQNIDCLHQRAGSEAVIELHGSLMRTRCSSPSCDLLPFSDFETPVIAPGCSRCGSPLRPDVVLFDEPLPASAEWAAKRALRDCDLFLAVGTSGTVSPAANYVRSAEYAGARTVFVNLEPPSPPNPMFHEVILGRAEVILPELFGAPGRARQH